jgi:hypothetical protein
VNFKFLNTPELSSQFVLAMLVHNANAPFLLEDAIGTYMGGTPI